MLPATPGRFQLLRFGLFLSMCGWGISFFFTINPWSEAVARLYSMGAEPIEYQPLLGYWLKMASAVFGGIGLASALALWRPQRYEIVIRLLVPFHLFVGATLIVAAYANGLQSDKHPTFAWDIAFCFTTAACLGIPLLTANGDRQPERDVDT